MAVAMGAWGVPVAGALGASIAEFIGVGLWWGGGVGDTEVDG